MENRVQIQKYADFIGLNLNTYPELMWLAEEGLTCPVPEGWEIVKTQDSHHFKHAGTGATRPDHPMDDHYRTLAQKHMRQIEDQRSSRGNSPNSGNTSRALGATGGSGLEFSGSSSGRYARGPSTESKVKAMLSKLVSKPARYLCFGFIFACLIHLILTMLLTPLFAMKLLAPAAGLTPAGADASDDADGAAAAAAGGSGEEEAQEAAKTDL